MLIGCMLLGNLCRGADIWAPLCPEALVRESLARLLKCEWWLVADRGIPADIVSSSLQGQSCAYLTHNIDTCSRHVIDLPPFCNTLLRFEEVTGVGHMVLCYKEVVQYKASL